MKYKRLGKTDVEVSLICLGTMTWGNQNTEADAHEQLDYAMEQGVNFIDTAEMYPTPPSAETHGRTETIIGHWLSAKKNRDQVIITSKVAAQSQRMAHVRDGHIRLDRKNIHAAVDASLKRLKTDYIDLYLTHWPDRDTNNLGQLNYYHAPKKDETPLEETIGAMDELVKAGKIRFFGVSNETAWGLAEHLRIINKYDYAHLMGIQNPFNLLNRTFETGLSEFVQREQISMLAYSPGAMGTLSGKYLENAQPKDARFTLTPEFPRYKTSQGKLAIEKYVELARQNQLDPQQMALAYVYSRPFITSSIVGASKLNQLELNIASVDLELPETVIKGIEKIHTLHPNPCP